MQFPFVLFGQHSRYTYRALEYLFDRGVFPQLMVIGLPKARTPRKEPFMYYHFSRGENTNPSLLRGPFDIRPLAQKSGCDLLETEDANNPAVLAMIAGQRPQFFLTIGFSYLFSKNLLALAPCGALNLHPSILPQERGPAPFFWIWKKGEWENSGITLHYMNERADRGNIIAQEEVVINDTMTLYDYMEITGRLGGQLFYRFLQEGRFDPGTPQSDRPGSWAPRPQFEDLAVDPQKVTTNHLMRIINGLTCCYGMRVDLGVDRYFLQEYLDSRNDSLSGQYLLKNDILYLPVKDGLAVCRITEAN